jgi:hypothetical protein
MIGRKSIVGLALLAALAFSAVAAQGAAAAFEPSTNINAFTCAEEAGLEDYADAHCDENVGTGNGEYGHKKFTGETAIEVTNANTKEETTGAVKAVLYAKLAGTPTYITAETVSGSGTIKNNGGQVEGNVTVEYTNTSVDGLNHCGVQEPIEVKANFEGVDQGGEMGLRFEGAGANFTEITFTNHEGTCALNGITIPVKGSAIGTAGNRSGEQTTEQIKATIAAIGGEEETEFLTSDPTANGSGATTVFEPEHGMESLEINKNTPAYFWSHTTTVNANNGTPIAITTE